MTSPSGDRWAKVPCDGHPVFTLSGGGTTLRVWVRLCRWAVTSRKTATADRPLGHVVAGERRLADGLGLSDKTVRAHLWRLRGEGLIVVWRQPRRGAIIPAADGGWRGLATEFLVAPLAEEWAIRTARAGRASSEERAKREKRAQNGRFRTSNSMTTGNGAPVTTGGPLPVATGNGAPSYETLEDKTLVDDTERRKGGTVPLPELGNRVAYNLLLNAERMDQLPQLTEAQHAGIAHALTAELGHDESAIMEVITEASDDLAIDANLDEVRDVFAWVLGLDHMTFWESVIGEAHRYRTKLS